MERESLVSATARAAFAAGLAVMPPREDGSKQPAITSWAEFYPDAGTGVAARVAVNARMVERWYAAGRSGVGAFMGSISGNTELLEFDDYATFEAFIEAAGACGLGDLVQRIRDGYEETTPGGGIHWLTRCAEIAGNTKLARRPKRPDEQKHPNDRTKVLIETRGERGYAILAPTNGRVHPSGGEYRLLSGGVESIATITPEERSDLWALARTFDQLREPDRHEMRTGEHVRAANSRPGDDYITRTVWPDVLEPHGWMLVFERNGVGHWRRPGKDRGISATTNHADSDLLYVFSTSTEFESERAYNRFSAYAILNHGGDFQAAAKALSGQGYGESSPSGGTRQASGRRTGASPDEVSAVKTVSASSVPPFPVDALPAKARRLVDEGAAALDCPPDLIAVPMLAMTGGVMGSNH